MCSSRRLLAADAHDARIVWLSKLMRMMLGLPVSGVDSVAADASDAELPRCTTVSGAKVFRTGVRAWKPVADDAPDAVFDGVPADAVGLCCRCSPFNSSQPCWDCRKQIAAEAHDAVQVGACLLSRMESVAADSQDAN